MPKSPNHEDSRMESAILDIIELEDEISKDIVELVALKKEIVEVINTEYQTLLEEVKVPAFYEGGHEMT